MNHNLFALTLCTQTRTSVLFFILQMYYLYVEHQACTEVQATAPVVGGSRNTSLATRSKLKGGMGLETTVGGVVAGHDCQAEKLGQHMY
jgi:hypothetical protein